MKKHICCLLLFYLFYQVSLFSTPLDDLMKRILPAQKNNILFLNESDETKTDFFEIYSSKGKVIIKGNNSISQAMGLNWYLKYFCNVSASWDVKQSDMPKRLVMLKDTVRMETPLKTNFYLNYCTFSYSMPFWGWEEWEQEIDRMAMNGVTTPMAMIGAECVWRNTLKRFNYTNEEIAKFIPGPAYLGWFLMGNLEGMGGPLSDDWFVRQEELQKKIVTRMRYYGMEPVFQAFFGMVPSSLPNKYPEADVLGQGKWLSFNRPPILNPIDPLFEEMGQVWYEEYEKLFGITKYYAGDLFHEGGKSENINVTEAATQVQKLMQDAVPNSVWIIQSWGGNPTKDLLAGLQKDKTLIVDLCAEYWEKWNETKSFNGFPWIWGNITNWGGNIGLHGRLGSIAKGPIRAINDSIAGEWLKGIANVPEGIGTNSVVFDLACEMRWRKEIPDLSKWLEDYTRYRYGKSNESINAAWNIFLHTAYGTYQGHRRPSESYFCARPSLKVRSASAWGSGRIYYSSSEFEKGVKLFAKEKEKFKNVDGYEHDLVDFTRQMLANKGRALYNQIISSYKKGQVDSVTIYSNKFLKLILLQDSLLSCRKEFCVSTWINSARLAANTERDKQMFEYNARMLLTTWSEEDSQLVDYAHREWAGLLKEYYYPRWAQFFEWMKERLKNKRVDIPNFYKMERNWTNNRKIGKTRNANLYFIVDECLKFE